MSRDRQMLSRRNLRDMPNTSKESTETNLNRGNNALIEDHDNSETHTVTRQERVLKREQVRQQNEKMEEISQEEEEQIKKAIALSMMCHNGSAENHDADKNDSPLLLPIDPEPFAKNLVEPTTIQDDGELCDKDEEQKVIEGDVSPDDLVDNEDDSQNEGNIIEDGLTVSSAVDLAKEDASVDNDKDDHNTGDDGNIADDDEDDDETDDCRSSPLLFQTPSEAGCVMNDDEDMTQISMQSSVHSEIDIFATRKDKLSLKKRKREPTGMEQPSKTLRVETSDQEDIEAKEDSDILPGVIDFKVEDVPLVFVDQRPINKNLKPFYAPDSENKELYTSVILNMLNEQLKRIRCAQYRLHNYVAIGAPVEVGPVLKDCLRYRRRGEKPFVFFDSEDEEEEINDKSCFQKQDVHALNEKAGTEVELVSNCTKSSSARKRQIRNITEDMSDLSDFETIPKKPKLAEHDEKQNFDDVDKKVTVDDDDDVLYAGETLPLFEDVDVNEEDEDSLLRGDSPVVVIVAESDKRSSDDDSVKHVQDNPVIKEALDVIDNSDNESQDAEVKSVGNNTELIDRSSDDFKIKPENQMSYEEQRLYNFDKRKVSRKQKNKVTDSFSEDGVMDSRYQMKLPEDGNESDRSSASGAAVVVLEEDLKNQGFFARKRQTNEGVTCDSSSTGRNYSLRQHQASPVIPNQMPQEEHSSPEHVQFDMEKDGIVCPLCSVRFHPDLIERHASECNGPVEEEDEPEVINEVLNVDPECSTASQMERDHEDGWLFSEPKKTLKYGRKNMVLKPAEQNVYAISDSSDEDHQPVRNNKRVPCSNTNSGPDHVDQVVSEMIGRKELSIAAPRPAKKQKAKLQKKNSDEEVEMETCFMCKQLVPKSEYPAHVNQELEQQSREESFLIESQKHFEAQGSNTQAPRLRMTRPRKAKNKQKEEEEMEEGNLDDLIAFTELQNQEDDDDDKDYDEEVEIDEESDDTNGAVDDPFTVSDSPIKAFKSIKNTRAGFIDYNNQFNNKPKSGRVTDKALYPTTSKPQTRGRRKGRGRGNRGRGSFHKKK